MQTYSNEVDLIKAIYEMAHSQTKIADAILKLAEAVKEQNNGK